MLVPSRSAHRVSLAILLCLVVACTLMDFTPMSRYILLRRHESNEGIIWQTSTTDVSEPLRVRQHRQVSIALDHERSREYGKWYFTKPHNIKTLSSLLNCFLPASDPSYTACPPKPLVISGWWYTAMVLDRGTSGETIWMKSLVDQIERLGLSWITVGPYEDWIRIAEMMPDVYRLVWVPDVDAVSCITDPRCIAKEHYVPPEGAADLALNAPDRERGVIPIWAINIVDYWGARPREISNNEHWWGLQKDGEWSYHPLGTQWISTPWPLPGGHVHLPYSIEKYCLDFPYIPQADRNDSILLFAKKSSYFDCHYVTPRSHWTRLSRELNSSAPDEDPKALTVDVEILTTAKDEPGHTLPDGLRRIPSMPRDEYDEFLGSVKAVVGIGAPYQSPSVYTALCRGTPVVVPTFIKNPRQDGWHGFSGVSQHGPAAALGEPYVYTYHSQNYSSLLEAMTRAISTPIERYIPPDMSSSYALEKMREYLDRDLQAMFEAVLGREGGVPPLIGGIRERCYVLERCRPMLPPGRRPYVDFGVDRAD